MDARQSRAGAGDVARDPERQHDRPFRLVRPCGAIRETGMRYAFRVKSTFCAEVAMDTDKPEIIKEIVTEAENLRLGQGETAIFDVADLDLKVVVRFVERIIHVMTREEA